MDIKNIATNIYEDAFDMDMIGTTYEEKQDAIQSFERALKSLDRMSCNNVYASEYAALLQALQRIFER